MNNKTDIDVKYVSPLKKICMTIGELPASYLETMSYYEMLVWFTEFLKNQVIPTVNNNAEAVSELQALYEELRTYVNNYFDNLDVQDEINNKLEAMAESGQLTDIIAQYLGLAGMIAFDTVADMKLAENLVNGSKCCTLGYYSVNDGGNAFYKIRSITNDDTIDDKFIIELSDNNLIAELIIENNEVNVAKVGLKTQNQQADCSTDLQYLLDYVSTRNLILYFPADKTYQIKNPLSLKSNVNNKYILKGEKTDATPFNIFATECYQVFVGENFPTSITNVNLTISNLNIDCSTSYTITIFKGLKIIGSSIENCNFYHPYIFLEGALQQGCRFNKNRIQSINFAFISAICFKNNIIDYDTASALATSNGNLNNNQYIISTDCACTDSTFISENYISGNVSSASNKTSLFIVYSGFDSDFNINNNWIEFFLYGIRPFVKGASKNVDGTVISNNVFQYFYRFFENGVIYRGWNIFNNTFTGFDPTKLSSKNMTGSDIYNTYDCGIIISKNSESDYASFQNIIFNDNNVYDCSYAIKVVFEDDTNPYRLSIKEKGTKTGAYIYSSPVSKIIAKYYSNHGNDVPFTRCRFESLNYQRFDSLPDIILNDEIQNSFLGQIIFVGGTPYIACDNGTAFQYVSLIS